jgi:enoyl-CoA hydratase/carnithine racemase
MNDPSSPATDPTSNPGDSDRKGPPEGDWLGSRHLHFERLGSLAMVTVDRLEARNALTPAMYFGIRYAVGHVERDPDLAGLLITGKEDVFIPGGDMGGTTTDSDNETLQFLGMDVTPFDAVRRSTKPVVSAVNGLCQGGGLMIAMLSDVTVASDRATFRAPELLRGIADTNYGQMLPRQIGPARARDMLMTGRVVTATEAEAWGLVARVVPHDELIDAAIDVLKWCARTAPGARTAIKRDLDRYYGQYDRIAMETSLGTPESIEGFYAFKERRSPTWVPEDLQIPGRL